MRTVAEIRQQIREQAKSGQDFWGVDRPVISLALLEPLLDELVRGLTTEATWESLGRGFIEHEPD